MVSEGAHYADGKFLAEQGSRDSFGHAQLGGAAPVVADLIKQALGYKFHWLLLTTCSEPHVIWHRQPMSNRHTRWEGLASKWL